MVEIKAIQKIPKCIFMLVVNIFLIIKTKLLKYKNIQLQLFDIMYTWIVN